MAGYNPSRVVVTDSRTKIGSLCWEDQKPKKYLLVRLWDEIRPRTALQEVVGIGFVGYLLWTAIYSYLITHLWVIGK